MCTVTENIFHPCPPAFRSIRFSRIGKKGKFYILFFKKIMHTIHSYCFLVVVDTNKFLAPLFYRIFLQPQISTSPIFLPMNNLKSGSFPKIIVNSTQPYFWMSIRKVKRLHTSDSISWYHFLRLWTSFDTTGLIFINALMCELIMTSGFPCFFLRTPKTSE